MRARLLPALAALVALAATTSLGYPPVPPPKPAKGAKLDLKALEGTWTVVKYESGMAKAPSFTALYQSIVIKGNTWTQVRSAKGKGVPNQSYTFTLDATKTPGHIDMTMNNARDKASGSRRGILELKGDELIVAYGMISKDVPRPEKPDAKLAGLQYRWVLKREKP